MKRKHKILFVDDDTSLNQILEKILREDGFEVDVAVDGIAAMNLLKEHRYDVAILDNYLPLMNGIDVLKSIRQDNLADKVIMITAVDERSLARESKRLGANEILAKPFEFEKLISCIQRLCPPEIHP
jgi:DNA-binding response OmpR family regulator